ncbi:hypothetical protein WAI453_009598 [Rhynchosporium graminicola]
MCDYTQVEFLCGHRRYTVRAWCINYETTHRRCPPAVVAVEFRRLSKACNRAKLDVTHQERSNPHLSAKTITGQDSIGMVEEKADDAVLITSTEVQIHSNGVTSVGVLSMGVWGFRCSGTGAAGYGVVNIEIGSTWWLSESIRRYGVSKKIIMGS